MLGQVFLLNCESFPDMEFVFGKLYYEIGTCMMTPLYLECELVCAMIKQNYSKQVFDIAIDKFWH